MQKLSIITINYNNKEGLYRTLESVRLQRCKDFEYIVIDGGSNDGSVDLLHKYEQDIDYWVSEPDRGIYEAMNKGVNKASGKYCLFLNSGDWLHSDAVVELSQPYLELDKDLLIGYQISAHRDGHRRRYNQHDMGLLSMWRFIYCSIPHQSTFIKRELLLEFRYDEDLKIVSDWKFFIGLFAERTVTYHFLPFEVANFDTSGVSSVSHDSHRRERMEIVDSYLHPKLLTEITKVPIETIETLMLVPNSRRMQRIISCFIKILIKIHALINPNASLAEAEKNLIRFDSRNKQPIKEIDFELQ